MAIIMESALCPCHFLGTGLCMMSYGFHVWIPRHLLGLVRKGLMRLSAMWLMSSPGDGHTHGEPEAKRKLSLLQMSELP